MLELTGVIVKGFEKANKRGGDGENGWCLASKMSGEKSVKDNGILRKLGRVMGIVQNKQVAVDFGWELEKIGKLIAKINGSRKRGGSKCWKYAKKPRK